MAPEVVEQAGATSASDIWSLGALVIELMTGKPPYSFLQPMAALFRIVNDDCPPIPVRHENPIARDDQLIQKFKQRHRNQPLLSREIFFSNAFKRKAIYELALESYCDTPGCCQRSDKWIKRNAISSLVHPLLLHEIGWIQDQELAMMIRYRK
jgi:serine/threonine protein kinase